MNDPTPISEVAEALVARARAIQAERRKYGTELDEAAALREAEQEKERAAQRLIDDRADSVKALLEEAPKRFRDATFDDLTLPDDNVAALTEWAERPRGRNVLLAGTVGTGKTHTAIAVARLMLSQVHRYTSVQVTTAVGLLDTLRPGWTPPHDEWAHIHGNRHVDPFQRVCGVGLLVLDDLGVERPTEWASERMSEAIDHRWREELPIIATTNLTLGPKGQLVEAVGERAYSRLVGCDAVVVRMSGDDRRRRRAS